MRTDPGNKGVQASWLWPGPSGAAADLEFVDLRLAFVELQVLELRLLQELWFLNLEIPKLEFLELDILRLEPLKVKVLDSQLELPRLELLGHVYPEKGLGHPKLGGLRMRLRFPWLGLVLVELGFLWPVELALLELLLSLELSQDLDLCSLGVVQLGGPVEPLGFWRAEGSILVLQKGLSGHMGLYLSFDFHPGRWEGPVVLGQGQV